MTKNGLALIFKKRIFSFHLKRINFDSLRFLHPYFDGNALKNTQFSVKKLILPPNPIKSKKGNARRRCL